MDEARRQVAVGMGGHVTIIDRSLNRLRELDDIFNGQVVTLASNAWTIGENLKVADLVIGAVLMAFTLSLDDFIISFFLAGAGSTTLPVKVYGMLKTAVTPEVNALSAVLVVVSMVLVAMATWIQRK